MPSAAPTARLEARISTELHAMLKRAAEIQGHSLTDFVVSAVQEAAQHAIKQGEVVRLSLANSERFAQALLSPPAPSQALGRAFGRRPKLLPHTSKAQVKTCPSRLPYTAPGSCWNPPVIEHLPGPGCMRYVSEALVPHILRQVGKKTTATRRPKRTNHEAAIAFETIAIATGRSKCK